MKRWVWFVLALLAIASCRPPVTVEPTDDEPDSDAAPTGADEPLTVQSFGAAHLVPQSGHPGGVADLAFDSAGQHLVSVDHDKLAMLWDLSSGTVARVFPRVDHPEVRVFDIKADLLGFGTTFDLEAWRPSNGTRRDLGPPASEASHWTPDGEHIYDFASPLRVWARKGAAFRLLPQAKAFEGKCCVYAVLPGPNQALAYGDNAGLRVVDLADGTDLLTLEDLRECGTDPCFATGDDGHRFAVVDRKGRLRVYQDGDATPIADIDVGDGTLVGMDRAGERVLVRYYQVAVLYSVDSGLPQGSFRGGDAYLEVAALSQDGKRVALGANNGLWVFDAEQATEVFRAPAQPTFDAGIGISDDGRYLYIGRNENSRRRIDVWDLDLVARVRAKDMSHDLRGDAIPRITAIAGDSEVWWQNARGYLETVRIDGQRGATAKSGPQPFASPDGTRLLLRPSHGRWSASIGWRKVTVYDAKGRTIGEHELPPGDPSVGETEDGFAVATLMDIHYFAVGKRLRHLRSEPQATHDSVIVDGGTIAQARRLKEGRSLVERVPLGKVAEPCGEPVDEGIRYLGASRNADWVVTQHYDGTIRAWDCEGGTTPKTFAFQGGTVSEGTFARNAPIVALTSNGGGSAVIKLDTGRMLTLHADSRDWVAVGADNIFAGSSGAARLVAASNGTNARSIDQYAVHLNRPDRLMQWWGTTQNDAVEYFRAIAERRAVKAARVLDEGAVEPPAVRVRAGKIVERTLSLAIRAADAGGELRQISVFVDGTTVERIDAEGSTFDGSVDVELTPGDNLVEVTAVNAAGLESERARLRMNPAGNNQAGQRTIAMENPRAAAFSPDGRTLAVLTTEGELQWIDPRNGAIRRLVPAHGRGTAIAYADSGEEIYTTGFTWPGESKPETVAWNAKNGKQLRRYDVAQWVAYDLLAHDEYLVAIGSRKVDGGSEGGFSIWRTSDVAPLRTRSYKGMPPIRVFSVGDHDFAIDAARWSYSAMAKPEGSGDVRSLPASSLAASPDGTEVVTWNFEIKDATTGAKRISLDAEYGDFDHVIWFEPGRLLAFGNKTPATLFDAKTGQRLGTIGAKPSYRGALSRDGTRWAALHFDGIDVLPVAKAVTRPSTRLFFVGVGVSDYADDELDLELAHADAKGLADAFGKLSGFDEVKVATFIDGEVDRKTFARVRSFVADAGPNDTVIVFVAGHGATATTGGKGFFFLPSDVDPRKLTATAIPYREIEEVFASASARRKLLLLDACESGDAESPGERRRVSSATARGLTVRGVRRTSRSTPAPERSSTAEFARERDRFVLRNLLRRTGAVVFSAAGANENALEDPRRGHGLFTAAILEVLAEASSDRDGSGGLDMRELELAVRAKVAQWSDGLQNPRVDRENIHARIELTPAK